MSFPSNHRGVTHCFSQKHLYLIEEEVQVPLENLVQCIHVLPCGPTPSDELKGQSWLEASPAHFYLQFKFPGRTEWNWEDRQPLDSKTFPVCGSCFRTSLESLATFESADDAPTLSILDLFAGCGAFSQSIAEGCPNAKLTHAVEISPSAASTIK